MSAALLAAAGAALLALGYGLGRYRPARRTSDWAHWEAAGRRPARHTARWWVMYTILSVEELGWLLAHPVQAAHAWRHRNDPPPPRGPALRFDPEWAAKRRAECGPECSEQHTYAYRCALRPTILTTPLTILGVDAEPDTHR
ncbi:hypothetical protein ACF1BE_19750 [Streptomyces sp. NPDC014991]|uniref:hypothetical protein n=1 Tax=Streptomyces sp. NPDC014991 TaxID=3364935 RepID=UPI0036FB77CC